MDDVERAQRNLKRNDPASLKRYGETLVAAGRFEQAVEAFSQALDLRDGDPALLNCLGNAWRAQRRYEEAAYFYGKAVEAAPNYAVAHASLGDCHIGLENYAEAARCLEASLKLAASEAARMSLAYAYRKLGKDGLALELYRKLLEANPRNFRARLFTLRIYEEQGKLDEAWLGAKEMCDYVKNGPLADEARELFRRVSRKRRGETAEGEAEPGAAEAPAAEAPAAEVPAEEVPAAEAPAAPEPVAPEPAGAPPAGAEAEDGEAARLTVALIRNPVSVAAHLRLADRLFDLSRFDEACLLYRKAVELSGIGEA